jgi:bla regulator protein BlaR1
MNTNYVTPFLSCSINHLWQSTLFAALAWLLIIALLRNNRPQARYAVWLAASVKFLIPFATLIDLGSRLGWMKLAAPKTQVSLYYAMDQVSRRAAPQFIPSALRPTVPAPGSPLPSLLVIVWACGIAVVAIGWWLSWRRVREAVQAATPIRIFEGIPVLSSPALRERGLEPGVFGLRNPVVLVPDGITERLSPAQLDAVLAHECCHARRRDNLAAAMHMIVEALFWFHPLVWWLGNRMMQERERACDEEVLRRTGEPEVYAEGILNVCKFYLESPLVCVAGITGSNLKQRIEEIMTHRIARELGWARTALLAVAAAMAIAGPVGIGLLRAPVTQAQTMSSFTGMQTSAAKQFEVATVKVNRTGSQGWRLGPPAHGSVSIENLQLHRIIASSFRIQDSTVFGPAWLDSTRYDIVGKGPDPNVANPEVWEMMRSLLAERFRMKYHIETRQLPIYALVVAKGGPKLRKPEDGPCASAIREGQTCGDIGVISSFRVAMINMPVGALMSGLARSVQDRPIVDKTGLTAKYDAEVRWMPDNMKPEDLTNIPENMRPEDVSLFTAIEQQLGLKLEAQKGPVQVVVVDSIEDTSGN